MNSLLAAALVIGFAAQSGKALAYAQQQQLLLQFIWARLTLAVLRARAREAHSGMS